MTKRPISEDGGVEVAVKIAKEDPEEEKAQLKKTLEELSKEELVEKCLGLFAEQEKLNVTLKKAQRLENLARIRYTLKDKEHKALVKERSTMRWKLLGDAITAGQKGLQMDSYVHEAFFAMREEVRNLRVDLESAKTELRFARGKAGDGTKDYEKLKTLTSTNESLKQEAKRKLVVDKELALCYKANQGYKQHIKELEKQLNDKNERIKALEEGPRIHHENGEDVEEVDEIETSKLDVTGETADDSEPKKEEDEELDEVLEEEKEEETPETTNEESKE